ncbi:MAG: ATP-binding protein [Myxococcota bacterium]
MVPRKVAPGMHSRDIEQLCRRVAQGTATATGEAFFGALVRSMAASLGTRWALVSSVGEGGRATDLALWDAENEYQSVEYELAGTPCEAALRDGSACYPSGLRALFPDAPLPAQMGIESYTGVRLVSGQGAPLGVLCAFHDGPLPDAARDSSLLQIFASRAAAELERMAMQRALEASEAYTRGILDSSPDGILAVDDEEALEFANRAARSLFRIETEEVAGISLASLLPGLDLSNDTRVELLAHRRDGGSFPAAVSLNRLDLAERSIRIIVLRDITARIEEETRLRSYAAELEHANAKLLRAKAEAEQAARAKSQFLANVSHEIRTPMTAILGYSEMLLDEREEASPAEVRRTLRTIRRNGLYLLEVLNDVLDLSKIEAERLELERTDCSPVGLLRSLDELLRVRAERKGISLEVRLVGSVPESVETDPTRLRQILINLVGNAIKFTRRGSVRVTLRQRRDPLRLAFEVEDTGIGIRTEDLESIFEPFSQADSSMTRRFGGTGLGLAISRRLAELLGGTISVESEWGRGSCFRVEVPVVQKGTQQTSELGGTETDTPHDTPRKNRLPRLEGRVLVVEDGPDNQRILRHILERAGCEVTVAENGQVGVERALAARDEGSPYDVVLMDIQMPVLDGHGAMRKLRAAGYDLPIIALTAHALAAERAECMASGCDGFATKPVHRRKLLGLMERYMAAKSSGEGS